MLISNIIGGLGNQMFQYAAARALSLRLDKALKVDISDFSEYKLHQGFELDKLFNVSTEVASVSDLKLILGWQKNRLMRRIFKRPQFKFLRHRNYVVEPQFSYWKGINQLKDNIYLDGYWQSEKYFIEFSDKIRADFTFKLPFSKQNAEIAKYIAQVNAVSLHVRRGDYVSNPKNISIYSVCSPEYYSTAVTYIAGHVDNPYFFIFSDDIEWSKNNLKIDFQHQYITHNKGSESHNDMHLMSLCKHNIIANSSFSWWGAWLNTHKDKMVIAPTKWFVNATNASDLIPNDWIQL